MKINDKVNYKGKVYFVKSLCNHGNANWCYMLARNKDDLYTKWLTVWSKDEHLVLSYDNSIPEFKQISIFDL